MNIINLIYKMIIKKQLKNHRNKLNKKNLKKQFKTTLGV